MGMDGAIALRRERNRFHMRKPAAADDAERTINKALAPK
jgi:hypothetical protein